MKRSSDAEIDEARISLDQAGGDTYDDNHANVLLQSSIAHSLIAIALELERFNSRRELDMGCLEVLSDLERAEIKYKKAKEFVKDLG